MQFQGDGNRCTCLTSAPFTEPQVGYLLASDPCGRTYGGCPSRTDRIQLRSAHFGKRWTKKWLVMSRRKQPARKPFAIGWRNSFRDSQHLLKWLSIH